MNTVRWGIFFSVQVFDEHLGTTNCKFFVNYSNIINVMIIILKKYTLKFKIT